jgi:hypothetical protein
LEAYLAFVKKIVEAFGGTDLDYAFTGALAISYYGVPRTTSDIDVIIEVANRDSVKTNLSIALNHAGLAVDEQKIDSAFNSGFKIATFKDNSSPFSIDVIFSDEKLDKQAGEFAGIKTFFQSPEGLIAAKLRMIKVTLDPHRVTKDREDIKAVMSFTKVDLAKLKKQSKRDNTLSIFVAEKLAAKNFKVSSHD